MNCDCPNCGSVMRISEHFDDDPDTRTDEENDDEETEWMQQNDPIAWPPRYTPWKSAASFRSIASDPRVLQEPIDEGQFCTGCGLDTVFRALMVAHKFDEETMRFTFRLEKLCGRCVTCCEKKMGLINRVSPVGRWQVWPLRLQGLHVGRRAES